VVDTRVPQQPATYFLQEAAELALQNILARLDPALDEQPYFQLDWGSDPPEARHASWDYCDMAGRYVDALILMRQMTGNRTGLVVEERLRSFLLARANPQDGLFYDAEAPWSRYGADMFCQGRTLLGLVSWFLLTGDAAVQASLDALIAGLSRIAVHHDDYCVYPKDRWIDGSWVEGGLWNGKAPGYAIQQVIGIARYYEATGSPAARELAGKLARYFVYHSGTINFDGTFQGHTHSGGILPSTLGVLRYALLAHDRELIAWSQRVYEYARSQSSAFGWVPDGMACDLETNPFASTCETCSLADMIEIALKLSQAGVGDYWDDVERFARNQLLENQFRDVDRVVPPEGRAQSQTPVAAILYGSFESTAAPNSLLRGPQSSIEGCCVGAGGRACFLVWDQVIVERPEGVFVNLLFSRNSPWARLTSFEPYRGEFQLQVQQPRRFYARVPGWAQRDGLRVLLDGVPQATTVKDGYLDLGEGQPGQTFVIGYPQERAHEHITIAGKPYDVRWKGGTVTAIEPAGTRYPIYQRAAFEASEPPRTTWDDGPWPLTVHW
jgi:hypothetical protein